MGEEIGSEMALRTFGHLVGGSLDSLFLNATILSNLYHNSQFLCLTKTNNLSFSSVCVCLTCFWHQLRYGEPTLRRAVPLALALISVSNPRLNILDTLSKFSHDADPEVSHNSIFAMGMVGSGESDRRHGVT